MITEDYQIDDPPKKKIPSPQDILGKTIPKPEDILGEKKNLGGTPSLNGGSLFPSVSETLLSSNGKKKDDGNKWVKTPPASISEGIQKDKKKDDSVAGGIYNMLVGSVSRLVGGIGQAAQSLGKSFVPHSDILPIPDIRQPMAEFVDRARTESSSKENEQARSQFDITDGVQKSDVRALLFQAPSQILDMVGGALTYGSSFFLQAANDAAKELDETPDADKMSHGQKTSYVYANAAIQGLLDYVPVFKVLKSTGLSKKVKQKIANEVVDEAIKKGIKLTAADIERETLKKAASFAMKVKKVGLKAATGFAYEAPTEALQQAGSDATKLLANKIAKHEIFDEEDITTNFIKNTLNAGVQGGAFGLVFGGGSQTLSNTNKAIRNEIAKAQTPEDVQKIQQDIAEQVELGNITEEEANAASITAQQYAEIASKIPQEIDAEKKYAIIGGIEQRENLKSEIQKATEELSSIDPAFHGEKTPQIELLQAKLEQTNDYIDGLVADKKVTYKKEGKEGEEKYIKTMPDGKEVDISKEHYELGVAVREEEANKKKKAAEPLPIQPQEESQDIALQSEEINQGEALQSPSSSDTPKEEQVSKNDGGNSVGGEKTYADFISNGRLNEISDKFKSKTFDELKTLLADQKDKFDRKVKMGQKDQQLRQVVWDLQELVSAHEKANEHNSNLSQKDTKSATGDTLKNDGFDYVRNKFSQEGGGGKRLSDKESNILNKEVDKLIERAEKENGVKRNELKQATWKTNDGYTVIEFFENGRGGTRIITPKGEEINVFDNKYKGESGRDISYFSKAHEPFKAVEQSLKEQPKAEGVNTKEQAGSGGQGEAQELAREQWAAQNEYRINELADIATSEKHFHELIDKEIGAESKKIPKLAEDDAENKHAIAKLTEQDNPIQEPGIKIVEGQAASQNKADLNEAVEKADELIGAAIGVKRKKLSEINTDEARFQGRAKLNEGIINEISKNFSDADQDPIHVWKDPKNGRTYVLSGHHRYYGAKKAGRNDVKVIDRSKDFTEQQAIKFAKEEANANRSMETPLERANTLRDKRERGDDKKEIAAFLEKEGKNKTFVENLSHLNPKGKTVELLNQFERAEDKQTQKESERIADWIGEARKRNPQLTNTHENEMFDYLKSEQRVTNKVEFVEKVTKAAFGIRENESLNLKKVIDKSDNRIEWEKERDDLKAKVNELKSQAERDKQTGWTGLQKEYITRLANDRFKGDIEAAEKEFKKPENQEIYNRKLEEKKNELKAVQDKLAKHLLKENDLIKGDKSQQSLFEEPEAEYGKTISIDSTNPSTVEIGGNEVKMPHKPANGKQLTYTIGGVDKATVTIYETPRSGKFTDNGKIQHSETFNTFKEAFEYAEALKSANIKSLYEYKASKENKTLPATGGNLTNGGRTTSVVSEDNPQYGKDSPYQKALQKVREKTSQDLNETLQADTKGTQPVSPEEKSDSKKLATEAGDGAKEPPAGEPPERADGAEFEIGGEDITGITHAQTEATRERFSLPEYEREAETIAKWDAEAEQAIKDGYNIENLLAKMERGEMPTAVEQRIMLRYIATLEAKVEKNPSDENLLELKQAIQLSDRAGGSIVGKSLVARKGSIHRDDSLASFFIREMEESEVDVLTEAQKEKVKKEFEEIKAANAAYQKKVEELQKEIARLKAEAEISKQKRTGSTKRKTHEEYAQERKKIADDIKEKLKKARQNTQLTVLPYANDLIAIAPDVAKLMKSYVSEGVDKLSDIVDNIHEILKDHIPEITTKDIQDIIAGEYTAQKKTRNELAAQLRDLKTEAQLLNQYEKLEQGEVPNNEKKKIQRNQKLTELRTKIKEHNLTRLSDAKERIKKQIEKIEGQIRTGDFAVQEKKQPIKLDKEGQELQDKLIKLKQDREVRILKERYENRSVKDKAIDKAIEVANVPRSIMASMDYSAPLRQAIIATIAHPRTALMAAREMFISSLSQKNFDRWFFDLKNDPNYTLMQDSGLSVTDPHSPFLTAKEEAYMNNLSEKIPIIGRLIKGSERAYVQYLNKMRVDLFNRFSDRFAEQGKTFENSAELYKKMAEYINNQTGRGKMGKLEEYAPVLNTLFFSPRLISSRLNLLNPVYFAKLPKELKAMYAKDMLKFLGVGLGVLALAKFSSGDDDENKVTVETDPRSSDFMKLRQKNTRWDVWGGFQPYVRLIAQMITGQSKSANSGKIYEIDGKGAFGRDRADLLKTFFRNKLAPIPSGAINVLSGKNTVGEDVTIGSQFKEYFIPLNYTGIKEGIQDEGVKALFTVGIPSTFGIGVQTYEQRIAKNTFKIYTPSGDVKDMTPEQVEKYKTKRKEIEEKELSEYKKGVKPITFDIYKEMNLSEDLPDKLVGKVKRYNQLTPEEIKSLETRIKQGSDDKARQQLRYFNKQQAQSKENRY